MNDFMPSDELIAHVKVSEGLVLVPRPDPVGIVTYGYGHRTYAGENIPPSITEEHADLVLASDLQKASQAVRLYVEVEMSQDQFDALTDFSFNFGAQALHGSTMLHRVNADDWEAAAHECGKWIHDHAGNVLPGLVTRREWDAERLFAADTIASTVVYVAPIEDPAQQRANEQMVADFKSEGTMTLVPDDGPTTAA